MIILYMYHDDLVILYTRYPSRDIIMYVCLLLLGLSNILQIAGREISNA